MLLRRPALAAAVIVATGCGDNLASPDAAPSPDAGRSAVTGSWARHYHPDGAEPITEPFDLSSVEVTAWVPGSDGSLDPLAGSGDSDGRFIIEDVPEVPVVIEVGGAAVHTDRRHIDLGADWQGRPDWAISNYDAILRIDADGLSPWAGSDVLLMSSSNVGIEWLLHSDTDPAPQSTSLAGIDFLGPFPLIDASKGDRISFYQGREGVLGGTEYGYLESVFEPEPIDFDPAITELTGQFATIARDKTFHVEWNVLAWHGYADQSHPGAFGYGARLGLVAQPGSIDDYVFRPTLLWVADPTDPLDLPYGDPYPASWRRTVMAQTLVVAEVLVPGRADASYLVSYMERSLSLEEYGAGPLPVVLSPPRLVQVNGVIAYQNLTNVGISPEVAWQPPSLGQPDGYRIEIYRFVQDQSAPEYVSSIITDSTSVTIPPGLLTPGEPYALVIVAVAAGDADFVEHPYRLNGSRSEAPAFTAVLIP